MDELIDNITAKDEVAEEDNFLVRSYALFSNILNSITNRKKSNKENTAKTNSAFLIWKELSGRYRWMATYSNIYRDAEQEIISSKSQRRFTELVDKGVVDYPALLHWHVQGTDWGKADFVHYDEETGFSLASGYVLEGHEKEAEAIINSEKTIGTALGVSHGMPVGSIKRETDNPLVIEEHITVEISDLPLWAAANQLTNFEILKEVQTMIPNNKKAFLRDVGLSEEKIAEIEQSLDQKASVAKDSGLDFKESELIAIAEVDVNVSEKETEIVEAVDSKEEELDKEEDNTISFDPAQFLVAIQPITEMLKQVNETLVSLATRVEGLESKETKQAEKDREADKLLSLTPSASIAAILAKSLVASTSEDTKIRKDSKLATDKPEEAESFNKENIVNSGNPIIDSVLSSIVKSK